MDSNQPKATWIKAMRCLLGDENSCAVTHCIWAVYQRDQIYSTAIPKEWLFLQNVCHQHEFQFQARLNVLRTFQKTKPYPKSIHLKKLLTLQIQSMFKPHILRDFYHLTDIRLSDCSKLEYIWSNLVQSVMMPIYIYNWYHGLNNRCPEQWTVPRVMRKGCTRRPRGWFGPWRHHGQWLIWQQKPGDLEQFWEGRQWLPLTSV